MPTERELREQLSECGRMLWNCGLVGAFEGNLSARLDANRVLVSPANVHKVDMRPESLVIVDVRNRWVSGGSPTSELPLHLAVYEAREDVMAAVHAHPPTATGFSIAGETLPNGVITEADLVLGEVALVPYAPPGTTQLADRIKPYLPSHNVFLMSHHGALTLGGSIKEAYNRMEVLERCSQMILAARVLGRVHTIPRGSAGGDGPR
ncbi:MAG: aldolase [Fimbriimonadales bacterium]